jgi:hypothetical protein
VPVACPLFSVCERQGALKDLKEISSAAHKKSKVGKAAKDAMKSIKD